MVEALDVRLVRRTASWAIVSVPVLWMLTLGVDVALVVSHVHLRPGTLRAGFADGTALGAIVTLLAAPLASALEVACLRIATGPTRWHKLWPVPIALAAAVTGLAVSGLSLYGRTGGNAIVVAGFTA